MDKAAEINAELAEIEDQQGGRMTRLAWPELFPEQPLAESRLARWRRMCEAEGYEV